MEHKLEVATTPVATPVAPVPAVVTPTAQSTHGHHHHKHHAHQHKVHQHHVAPVAPAAAVPVAPVAPASAVAPEFGTVNQPGAAVAPAAVVPAHHHGHHHGGHHGVPHAVASAPLTHPFAGDKDQLMDKDSDMPFGTLEPFGREDTATELTEDSVHESNHMVDQMERAEVAEEKRSVFRALTRLRGAAITSFDGIARSQTSNIDEYNKMHKWRSTHPLHHLAQEEADVAKWAFPDDS